MLAEALALLVSHAVSLCNDRDDWDCFTDGSHELQISRLELMGSDEIDACVVHVLELQLLKKNALSLITLVDVLLPD